MPKKLIPAGWIRNPCLYLLPADSPSAKQCGECQRGFSLWNGRRHCVLCGYVFHRNSCSSKVSVPGQFFKQRVCPTCLYYRNTAAAQLSKGEDFECLNSSGSGSIVNLSLCEDTAELVLCWKARAALKETADLSMVEVRKGFSHMAAHTLDTAVGDYEPLRCFSLFLTDAVGEQSTCHLRATSALTCQLWVEGLKAAGYVYRMMLEQEQADEYYMDEEKQLEELDGDKSREKVTRSIRSKKWYRPRYLPLPTSSSASPPAISEEWENIPFPGTTTTASEACGFTTSAVFPFPPKYSSSATSHNSSGYLSDLSFSLHSSHVLPRRPLSALPQSNRQSSFKRHPVTSTGTRSLPPTPGLPFASTTSGLHSLSLTPGYSSACSTPGLPPSSDMCSCHTARNGSDADSMKPRPPPPRSQTGGWLSSHLAWLYSSTPAPAGGSEDRCCDHCRSYCRLAAELDS